ncbi:MAG: endonuclease/exonuclease/phosphatase family protein [Gammaproteobacteria bacterium]
MVLTRHVLYTAATLLAGSQFAQAANPAPVTARFATFNASLNRFGSGDLLGDLAAPGSVAFDVAYPDSASITALSTAQKRVLQAHYVAEVLQRIDADVVLVNEFDYDFDGTPGTGSTPSPFGYQSFAARRFNDNFLGVAHGGGTTGRTATGVLDYTHGYTPTTNTGLHSGFDLDNNGAIDATPGDGSYGNDAFGFGEFAGKFGFTLYSRYAIKSVRTFQNFLWKDMPGNLLTNDPSGALGSFYAADEIAALRLSSKNHVDVTVEINGQEVHFLAAHPTPPVFDGAEDRNGKRNFDEIRFWKEYINGAEWVYDDQGGTGGLPAGAKFVIAGDYNADPCDGDSLKDACGSLASPDLSPNAIMQLLGDALVNQVSNPFAAGSLVPASAGGTAAATDPSNNGPANDTHLMDPAQDTADFNDAAPGNLRVDYVLPSANLDVLGGGVFWPERSDPDFALVGTFGNVNLFSGFPTSDHKAVFVDVQVAPVPVPAALPLFGSALLTGIAARRRRRV